MDLAITIIGFMIVAMSVLVFVTPATPIRMMQEWRDTRITQLRILASAVRIALGILLIVGAASTRYPAAIQVIGWLVLALGIVFLLISSATFKRLLDWVFSWLSPARVRIGGLFGAALGGFLAFSAT